MNLIIDRGPETTQIRTAAHTNKWFAPYDFAYEPLGHSDVTLMGHQAIEY
jgi:hypothetical protein